MSFCSNCGTKQNVGAKFCPSCGQPAGNENAPTKNNSATDEIAVQPVKVKTTPTAKKQDAELSGRVKKEVLQLSNGFFSAFLAAFFLMKVQIEGGFKGTVAEIGGDKDTAFIMVLAIYAAVVGVLYFTVRIQGINKNKPGWVLGTLIVLAGLTVLTWTGANFSNFNWADWAAEVVGLVQLYLLYAIYRLLNAAKTE